MKTTLTNARLPRRTAAMAACLAALFAGATACGTEHGTSSGSGTHPQAATSLERASAAKANQKAYLQRLDAQAQAEAARAARAQHADAQRWAHGYQSNHTEPGGYGDDRRQAIEQSQAEHTST